eukprot:jgi/Botrbrau1/8605/Bobra.0196s0005.1
MFRDCKLYLSDFGIASVLFSYVTLRSLSATSYRWRLSDQLAAIGGDTSQHSGKRCKIQEQAVLGRHRAAGNKATGRWGKCIRDQGGTRVMQPWEQSGCCQGRGMSHPFVTFMCLSG